MWGNSAPRNYYFTSFCIIDFSNILNGFDFSQVDRAPKGQSDRCFHVLRTDGSSDDFSFRKCLVNRAVQAGATGDQMQGLTMGWAGRFRPPGDRPAREHLSPSSRLPPPGDRPAGTQPEPLTRFGSPGDLGDKADTNDERSRLISPKETPASESPNDVVSGFVSGPVVRLAGSDPVRSSPAIPLGSNQCPVR